MRNKYYYMPLLIIFVFFSLSYSQSFSVNHIQEIILPGKNVERPQLSKDGSWLSLETYHERGGFEVYFVRLNNSSVVIASNCVEIDAVIEHSSSSGVLQCAQAIPAEAIPPSNA